MSARTSFTVSGPAAPIDVSIDDWGVPHISAETAHDAFFGQGFVTARARLFQIDWWRRRGLGSLAEVLGPDYIERDRAARLFLFRGDMRTEWLAYGDGTRDIVTAFTEGINSWILLTREDETLLSPEFDLLGHRPELWRPEDVVRVRSHGLYSNLEQEVARAVTIREHGAWAEELRRDRTPWHPLTVPDGLDLSAVTEDVLDVYRLALGPVAAAPAPMGDIDGSNNWVISGARTSTGRPLLANDPHRAMSVPSLRQLVHLTCPEFDVIGAGEPALPGVSIGHNGAVAFGLTIWNADQEDLYVYELHPTDPSLYRYRDTWERTTRITETITDSTGAETEVELEFTRHGPLLKRSSDGAHAYAVRAAWLNPGMAPYLVALRHLGARSAGDLRRGLERWGAPGVNHVYADTSGSIGWSPRAVVPIRPNWDGLLPVPGDGRYEWAGFRDAAELPEEIDPERGWIATANEQNLPAEQWDPVPVSYEWFSSHRMERISEVLRDDDAVSVAAAEALQNDYVNVVARRVVALLPDRPGADEAAEEGRLLLCSWDHRMLADSAAALVFEEWMRGELRRRLFSDAVAARAAGPSDDALAAVLPREALAGDLTVDLRLLDEQAHRQEGVESVLLETLAATVRRLRNRYGPRSADWAWGERNRTRMRHPLAAHSPAVPEEWHLPDAPRSGSNETVALVTPDPATGAQTTGASFRIVVDVGDWDRSRAVNTPGQDGDPHSPHYRDLFELWHGDQSFPLLYSADAVKAHTALVLRLDLAPEPETRS